ncbi:unnamed protein product, partial [Durusdinium trenchii]
MMVSFYLEATRSTTWIPSRVCCGIFWERYKGIDDVCPHDPELTIPFFLHGDEGRGQCHRPVLVLAAQPIIGWKGEECVTSTQHTFTTRLLLTVIPAQHYAANG